MQSFLAMVIANLKMTVRNKQAIFWTLAFPAIFIVMFGVVFNSGGMDAFNVGIAGADSELRVGVTQAMETSEAFNISEGTTEEELAALEDEDRSVVLVFPEDGSGDAIDLYFSSAGGPNTQIATGAVRSVVMDVVGATTGVTIAQQEIATSGATYMDWFIPGILGMALMNSGIIGIATAFVSFREQGILRRIKVTPFALWKFILARIVAALAVALVTSFILIGLGWLLFDVTVRGNIVLITGVLIVVASSMLAIGYAVAAIARNTETAASYANLITFPMMFLSGVFFPLGSMPDWAQPLIAIMPLKYGVEALRGPMLHGEGIEAIAGDLLVLVAVFAVCMVFAVRYFRWEEAPK
jgi:ABC-2 type transport system permease protein